MGMLTVRRGRQNHMPRQLQAEYGVQSRLLKHTETTCPVVSVREKATTRSETLQTSHQVYSVGSWDGIILGSGDGRKSCNLVIHRRRRNGERVMGWKVVWRSGRRAVGMRRYVSGNNRLGGRNRARHEGDIHEVILK